MSSPVGVLFLIFSCLLTRQILHATCDFSDQKEPIKTYCEAFKKSKRLILGEKVKPLLNKGEELIYRSKTKSWKGFDWKLRPLEFFALTASQEKYFERCESKEDSLLQTLVKDFRSEKIPAEDKKKALGILMQAFPCLDVQQTTLLQELSSEYFHKDTEDFLNILIGVESETTRYAADYKACTETIPKKYTISDLAFDGIEKSMKKTPMQKSLFLRLKRLRAEKMHYKTAQYFFAKIDNLIINKAEK